MTRVRRIFSLMSTAVFVAGTAFAATTEPPESVQYPSFAVVTQCQVKPTTGDVCCAGRITGAGTEDAVVRIQGLTYCQALVKNNVLPLSGELVVKPTQNTIEFKEVCAKPPSSTDCPASVTAEDYLPSDILYVTVEQPKGEPLFPGPVTAVVFP